MPLDGAYLAALETDLTPELEEEGLAREFVRRVRTCANSRPGYCQTASGSYYEASPKLAKAMQSFDEYILNETLAVRWLTRRRCAGRRLR